MKDDPATQNVKKTPENTKPDSPYFTTPNTFNISCLLFVSSKRDLKGAKKIIKKVLHQYQISLIASTSLEVVLITL